ncbi:MAG TPA: glycosyltransferase [Tenuifilaceae bacterium]|jgi:GT2 family glycosyltransferase|nr:glycosyltransferase [Bacteroidales bacterium]MDI9517531.1 glycosyltransferase [Bacteroidota bacterium]NLH56098.1 glycosyltransferase [Rikenellaceae bacterium]OQC64507.1 MAG: Hyaluronan synthase [Bacteroidetes bacterium ADurb.Bin008]HOF90878.1 glycosyltransferase [Tenuifilaceae bacterium]
MSSPVASLIISAYNNVRYLDLVIKSALQQTDRRFEVIVTEDAQHEQMSNFIQSIKGAINIRHITQPDVGWRKNRALNRAIEAAATDYLIFIDEDCVLHPRFIEFHIKRSDPDRILAGKRIKLDPETTQLILENKLWIDGLNGYILKNFALIKSRGAQFVEEGVFINPKGPLGFIPALRSMYQLKGCNMSFSRKAIYAINGFDEDYTRPAIGEDIDLGWRFEQAGYKMKSLRNIAVQYHLHHESGWSNQDENVRMMQQKKAQNHYVCLNGIKKLSRQ